MRFFVVFTTFATSLFGALSSALVRYGCEREFWLLAMVCRAQEYESGAERVMGRVPSFVEGGVGVEFSFLLLL